MQKKQLYVDYTLVGDSHVSSPRCCVPLYLFKHLWRFHGVLLMEEILHQLKFIPIKYLFYTSQLVQDFPSIFSSCPWVPRRKWLQRLCQLPHVGPSMRKRRCNNFKHGLLQKVAWGTKNNSWEGAYFLLPGFKVDAYITVDEPRFGSCANSFQYANWSLACYYI